ncbi:prepilin peptidase [Agrococcus beijingensis]|uniref:prepilin peptidase n=1 Tax=Agrococcus beijingensis TaxID=3068634 RepID=UPI002741E56A|nr:prepilin peptidase [Agrococcus sp. REN33]
MTTAAAPSRVRAPLRLRPVDLAGLPLAVVTLWATVVAGADAVAAVPLAAAAASAPALTRIDLGERRLPNAITLPLLAVGAVAASVRLASGDLAPLLALGCGALLLLMAVVGGMGMGDVKLGTALALATATLGWAAPLAGLAASVIVGGLAGVVALALGRRTLAFGPWLLAGNALAAAGALVVVL